MFNTNKIIKRVPFDDLLEYGNTLTFCPELIPSDIFIIIQDGNTEEISRLCRENIGKENYIIIFNSTSTMCDFIIFFRNKEDLLYFKLIS